MRHKNRTTSALKYKMDGSVAGVRLNACAHVFSFFLLFHVLLCLNWTWLHCLFPNVNILNKSNQYLELKRETT
jgi:hypothetical protein